MLYSLCAFGSLTKAVWSRSFRQLQRKSQLAWASDDVQELIWRSFAAVQVVFIGTSQQDK